MRSANFSSNFLFKNYQFFKREQKPKENNLFGPTGLNVKDNLDKFFRQYLSFKPILSLQENR
jgi:hypothetical protein